MQSYVNIHKSKGSCRTLKMDLFTHLAFREQVFLCARKKKAITFFLTENLVFPPIDCHN